VHGQKRTICEASDPKIKKTGMTKWRRSIPKQEKGSSMDIWSELDCSKAP